MPREVVHNLGRWLERRPAAVKQAAVKRERCGGWRVALLVFLESMVGENASDEQKARLGKRMLENTRPAKKAKSTAAVSTSTEVRQAVEPIWFRSKRRCRPH
jgi:hypothetical protein